jgi:hypothetical protein
MSPKTKSQNFLSTASPIFETALLVAGSQVSPVCISDESSMYRGADKFLAQSGRKQATATEDFDFHISYL